MLERVKLALRINHDLLNSEITETIAGARTELTRAGVAATAAQDDDDALISRAIITYCQMFFANDQKMKDGYAESFRYQLDNLRKSEGYRAEVVADV